MPATDPASGLNLPTYGRLLATKHVVPSARTGYVAVDRFLFVSLMAASLADVEVDEAWYLMAYPDIGAAIASGAITSVQQHYVNFGYFEHRLPHEILVDDAWYLQAHPDVKDAIAAKLYASAQEHYMAAGFREGRLPYAGFDLFGENPRPSE